MKEPVFTRREFLNSMLGILSIPAILWWLYVGRRNDIVKGAGNPVIIGPELPGGIHFFGPAILVNDGNKPRAYEAKCTHLGCQISNMEGDVLVCPCHGSRFDLSGTPVNGPAMEPLKELEISMDGSGNYIIERS